MRISTLLSASLAAALLLGSCTSHFLGAGGRLVIKAGAANNARAITGSTDIESATLTIQDITDGPAQTVLSEPFDWTQYEVDYQLPVGRTYRILLDIVPTPNAPGAQTGVLRYGDEDVVSLPDEFSAVVVFLNAKPSQTYAFHHRLGQGAPSIRVNAVSSGIAKTSSVTAYPGGPSDRDRFFYGADGRLYYFNKGGNKVYRWNDFSSPLNPTSDANMIFSGSGLGGYTIQAVTADSDDPDWFWVAALDGNSFLYVLLVSPSAEGPGATGTVVSSTGSLNSEFAALFTYGLYGDPITVTGIAQDLLGGVYLSYHTTVWGPSESSYTASGVVQTAEISGTILSVYPPNQIVSTDADSIVRDVTYQSGRVLAVVGPAVSGESFRSIAVGHGTADLWVLDRSLNPSGSIPSVLAQTYTGTIHGDKGDFLYRPTRFASDAYRGVLYVEQTGDGGAPYYSSTISDVTRIDLDEGTASFVDQQYIYAP